MTRGDEAEGHRPRGTAALDAPRRCGMGYCAGGGGGGVLVEAGEVQRCGRRLSVGLAEPAADGNRRGSDQPDEEADGDSGRPAGPGVVRAAGVGQEEHDHQQDEHSADGVDQVVGGREGRQHLGGEGPEREEDDEDEQGEEAEPARPRAEPTDAGTRAVSGDAVNTGEAVAGGPPPRNEPVDQGKDEATTQDQLAVGVGLSTYLCWHFRYLSSFARICVGRLTKATAWRWPLTTRNQGSHTRMSQPLVGRCARPWAGALPDWPSPSRSGARPRGAGGTRLSNCPTPPIAHLSPPPLQAWRAWCRAWPEPAPAGWAPPRPAAASRAAIAAGPTPWSRRRSASA